MNKFFLFLPIFFLSFFLSNSQVATQEVDLDEFLNQIQKSLELKDFESYLDSFSPELRDKENAEITRIFDEIKMESLSIFKSHSQMIKEDEAQMYITAYYQNSYSAILEMWRMRIVISDGRWQIMRKEVIGKPSQLYKISIPSGREERVRLFEVKHVDITITFRNATLFYDNVPGIETALIVVGDGRLLYSPSVSREKHQLELIYKRKFLDERLNYVYLRFSNLFFANNIRIIKEDKTKPVTQADRNKAYSLFTKRYSRSFTVENSLTGDLLSILPQGDEAVIEFGGNRIGNFTYIYSPFSEDEINLYQWKGQRIINLYSPQIDEGKKKFFISFGKKFDVKEYQLDIDFNPDKFYISGRAKIEIESKIGSLDALKFKLNPNLEILRILDAEKRSLFYSTDKLRETVYIYFMDRPSRNETTFIEIYYRGRIEPPEAMTDIVAGRQYEDRIILTPPKYETYLYSRTSYWYPAPANQDYFTARMKIIVPPDYSAVSNGILIEQSQLRGLEKVENLEKEGSSVFVYETKKPVKYLSFIVGKLDRIKEQAASIPLQFFRSKEAQLPKREIFDETKNLLQFFESRFGPYPFEKLSIVKRLWPTSGGHSPPSFVVLNEMPRISSRGRLTSTNSPVDLSRWKEYFLAHEIAHQWWGQGVTWDGYRDQWISEGLAQFSAVLYLKKVHGDKAFAAILKKFSQWTEKKSKWGSITMGSRISYHDFEAYQSIIYDKTTLVLNMLNDLLGDELFFTGIQKFFSKYKYSTARTSDFIRCFKEIFDRDLSGFFEKWFDSYILPEIRVTHSVERQGDGYLLNIKVVQLNDNFMFPLWIEWVENKNKVRKMFIIEKRKEEFNLDMKGEPKKLKVNPNKAVPGKFH